MVAVGEDDLAGGFSPLKPLQALARNHRVEEDPGGFDVVGVHGQPDLRVDRGPVVETREHLADRPVRCELQDRKSTRLNSSHLVISYAVFCLKKKKQSSYSYNIG